MVRHQLGAAQSGSDPQQSPLRFFISRGEWNKAEKAGSAYLFHVWDMTKNPEALYMRTVAEVAPHIPSDNEKGAWNVAQIPIVNS
jgi:hypothetical protein